MPSFTRLNMAHDGICKSDHYRLSPRGSDGSARAADGGRGGVLYVDIGGDIWGAEVSGSVQ